MIYFATLFSSALLFAIGAQTRSLSPGADVNVSRYRRRRVARRERRKSGYFDYIALVPLILLLGFRYDTGTDWQLYFRHFGQIDVTSLVDTLNYASQEVGFTFVNFYIKFSGNDFLVSQLFWSTLTVGATFVAYRELTESFRTAMLLWVGLGYYLFAFNVVRQSAAAALILLAIALIQRSRVAAAIVVALAALIHVSALIAIPILAIVWLRRAGRLDWRIVVAVGIPLALSGLGLQALLQVSGALNERYLGYAEQDGGGTGTVLLILVHVVALAVFSGSGKPWHDAVQRRASVTAAFGAVALAVGLTAVWVGRLDLYFGSFLPIVIANGVAHRRKPGLLAVMVGIATCVVYWAHMTYFGGVLPYTWWPR